MSDSDGAGLLKRSRVGWWLLIALLGLVAAYIAYSLVGMLVLGIFGYYATRPICRQFDRVFDSDGIAAAVTVLLVLLPVVVVALYASLQIVRAARQALGGSTTLPALVRGSFALDSLPEEQRRQLLAFLQNPQEAVLNTQETVNSILQLGMEALSALFGTLLFVSISVTLSFYLLKNDHRIAAGLRELFGGRDTTAYGYATAVDEDLQSVFFGNLQFVLSMTVVATLTYWVTNVLAPAELRIPMVFTLAFLTGVASLIPIVVGKIVYLPVVAYLGFQALESGHLVFVGGVLVAYFLLLDILPQTFLQPYLSGRQLDMMLLMFAYILGPVLFGWYGFFLLPILFVLMLEALRIVVPELLHGSQLAPTVSMGDSIGSEPEAEQQSSGTDGITGEDSTGTDSADT